MALHSLFEFIRIVDPLEHTLYVNNVYLPKERVIMNNKLVSKSSFSFLLSEYISYSLKNVSKCDQLTRKLQDIGYNIGMRSLEYISWLKKEKTRRIKIIDILTYICTNIWIGMFGSQAELWNTEEANSYIIVDKCNNTLNNTDRPYISSYYAGFIEGILDAAEFPTKTVRWIGNDTISIIITFTISE